MCYLFQAYTVCIFMIKRKVFKKELRANKIKVRHYYSNFKAFSTLIFFQCNTILETNDLPMHHIQLHIYVYCKHGNYIDSITHGLSKITCIPKWTQPVFLYIHKIKPQQLAQTLTIYSQTNTMWYLVKIISQEKTTDGWIEKQTDRYTSSIFEIFEIIMQHLSHLWLFSSE